MFCQIAPGIALIPHIPIDCVVFGFDEDELKVLVIERKPVASGDLEGNFMNKPALSGNLIRDDEDLVTNVRMVSKELTNLENIYFQQFGAFGDPDRVREENDIAWLKEVREEPMVRIITVSYYSLVKLESYKPQVSSFARKAAWYPVAKIFELASDHLLILNRVLICRRCH